VVYHLGLFAVNKMKDNRLSLEEFKYIYSKVPRLCVEVVIKTDEGILLTYRSIAPYKNLWHIPGGTVLYKETMEDAVKRVALEELGVEVEVVNLIGVNEYPSEEKDRGYGWPVGVNYLCRIIKGVPRGSEQASLVKFFKDLPPDMVEEQKVFLRKYNLVV